MQPDHTIPVAAVAPPLPAPISRRVWIGIALGAGLVGLLLCIGGGAGVSYLAGVGPLARPSSHTHFKREGDTLTISPLQPGVFAPPLALRRVK